MIDHNSDEEWKNRSKVKLWVKAPDKQRGQISPEWSTQTNQRNCKQIDQHKNRQQGVTLTLGKQSIESNCGLDYAQHNLQFRSKTTDERRIKERELWRGEDSTKDDVELETNGGKASQVISCSKWPRSMRCSVSPFRVTLVPGPRLSYVSSIIRPSLERHITTGGGDPKMK